MAKAAAKPKMPMGGKMPKGTPMRGEPPMPKGKKPGLMIMIGIGKTKKGAK
ncbi:MAG: hypothetical protein KGL39_05835 [Patescibacteria group bacterium]|nr:hypothetical protein [Patescibacteria group bacterium]